MSVTDVRPPALRAGARCGSALFVALLLHPYLLVLAIDASPARRLAVAAVMSLLLVQLCVLVASVALKLEWRISHRAGTGWLAVLFSFVMAQNVPFALLAVAGSPVGRYGFLTGYGQVVVVAIAVGFAMLAHGRWGPPRWNPLVLGLGLGAVVGGLRVATAHAGWDHSSDLRGVTSWAVAGVVTMLVVVVVGLVATCPDLPAWARARIAVVVVLLQVARLLTAAADDAAPSHLGLVLSAVAAVTLCLTALTLLRTSIADNTDQVIWLARQAAAAEASVRHSHEHLHEINATVAGIAHASQILVRNGGPKGERRARLSRLLDEEMERLHRMLGERSTQPVLAVDLDDVCGPVVATHRLLGHEVRWEPSGLRVRARRDDLAEALHVVLSNAARHAPGSPVSLRTAARDGQVELSVSDRGPGVPAALRPHLFRYGGRSPASPGSGIGLQIAQRLMVEQGGDLVLVHPSPTTGATFALTLPEAVRVGRSVDEEPLLLPDQRV